MTTSGYANGLVAQGNLFNTTDEVHVNYGSDSSSFGIFRPTISGSNVTLTAWVNPASITGSVVSGNAVKFSGTSGVLADAGYAVLKGTTASWGGGSTSHAFTATGLTSSWNIDGCVIAASTNAVSVCKAVASTNTITVTFSADPGAGTIVNWSAKK